MKKNQYFKNGSLKKCLTLFFEFTITITLTSFTKNKNYMC